MDQQPESLHCSAPLSFPLLGQLEAFLILWVDTNDHRPHCHFSQVEQADPRARIIPARSACRSKTHFPPTRHCCGEPTGPSMKPQSNKLCGYLPPSSDKAKERRQFDSLNSVHHTWWGFQPIHLIKNNYWTVALNNAEAFTSLFCFSSPHLYGFVSFLLQDFSAGLNKAASKCSWGSYRGFLQIKNQMCLSETR